MEGTIHFYSIDQSDCSNLQSYLGSCIGVGSEGFDFDNEMAIIHQSLIFKSIMFYKYQAM